MKSVDEGISILREFREHRYFINQKAINTFIEYGSNMDLLKTVNAICDPSLGIFPSKESAEILYKRLNSIQSGDYVERLRKRLEEAREDTDPEEEYTPYEHLRVVKENSDFFAIEPQVDIERDILGQSHS